MAIKTRITPSPSARMLFNKIVNAADFPRRGDGPLVLSLEKTVELSIERSTEGNKDSAEIQELINHNWIKSHKDGGWMVC